MDSQGEGQVRLTTTKSQQRHGDDAKRYPARDAPERRTITLQWLPPIPLNVEAGALPATVRWVP